MAFPATSPYHLTPSTSWYTGKLVFRQIPPDSGDVPLRLTLQYQYRPDKLSFDLYGTPSYWWVFCIRNPFLRKDPVWDFVEGITIMIPSNDYLKRITGS